MGWLRDGILGFLTFGFAAASATPDYLGQMPPDDTVAVFAPGIISTGNLHGRLTISKDGRDLFWTIVTERNGSFQARIMHIQRTGAHWGASQPFPNGALQSANPVFAPDGKKLYFDVAVGQPDNWSTQYVERTSHGWSDPKPDTASLNTSASFTRTNRIYYSSKIADKIWSQGIFAADYDGGRLTNVLALPPSINSKFIDYTPYVAPDERFLMFSSSRPSSQEDMHLFIAFRSPEGNWSEPRRMDGALGFNGKARFPSLSPDGRLLFFCGDDGNIYWIRSEAIQRLR